MSNNTQDEPVKCAAPVSIPSETSSDGTQQSDSSTVFSGLSFEAKNSIVEAKNIIDRAVSVVSPVPGSEVVKVTKPHSRTAVGEVVQDAMIMPSISAIEIYFEIKDKNGAWIPVKSRNLRRTAAEELLKKDFSDCQRYVSILVEPLIGTVRFAMAANKQSRENMQSRIKILEPGSVRIESNRAAQAELRWKARGTLDSTRTMLEKTLNAILRETSQNMGHLEPLPTSMGCNRYFDPFVPPRSGSNSPGLPSDYQLYLRHQAFVGVESERLSVKFDVVPCIPSKSLDRVVSDMSGQDPTVAPNISVIEKCLPQIRHRLLGARVRCGYIPGETRDKNREKATILAPSDLSRGRTFYIRDIIMPSHDPGFEIGNINKKHFKTYEYFEQMVLPATKKLNTALPLVVDGTGARIPIELVFPDGPQPLNHYGHLNEAIRKSIGYFLGDNGADRMLRMSKILARRLSAAMSTEEGFPVIRAIGHARFMPTTVPGSTKKPVLNTPHDGLNVYTGTLGSLDARIAVLFAGVVSEQAGDLELIHKVRHGLQSLSCTIRSATEIANGVVLKDEAKRCDLIFAIIENSRQDKKCTRVITRNLHSYAHRQLGVPLVCATTLHLAEVLKDALHLSSERFPASILAKINYKLGRMNLETSPQPLVRRKSPES